MKKNTIKKIAKEKSVYNKRRMSGPLLVAFSAAWPFIVGGQAYASASLANQQAADGDGASDVMYLSPSGVPYEIPEKFLPFIKDGQIQAFLSGNRITTEAWVNTPVDSDGDGQKDRIHVKIVRPVETDQGTRTPVIVLASPYNAGLAYSPNHNVNIELDSSPHAEADSQSLAQPALENPNPMQRLKADAESAVRARAWIDQYFLSRGFTIVYADSLGTAGSSGCPTIMTQDESIAMASVIKWLGGSETAVDAAGRPIAADWSTGHIGMYGVSYDGTLPKMVASLAPRGLDAIVPIAGVTNLYGYYRSGGLVRAPEGYQGEDVDIYMKILSTNAHPERCTHLIDEASRAQDRATGDYSDFWAQREITPQRAVAPALIAQGLTDDNVKVDQSTLWYQAMRDQGVPTQLWLHPWAHKDPIHLFTMTDAWVTQVNRWFTRYLLGVPNGVETEPSSVIEQRDGTLLKEASWPAVNAEWLTFYAGGDGATAGTLSTEQVSRGGSVTFIDDARIPAERLADAQSDAHRGRFDSPPLRQAMRISGAARATVRLTFSKAANVTALLVERLPDGSGRIISRAWADPRNRHSLRHSERVESGVPYDMTLMFMPRDYVIEAGHRIGLVVMSSDNDYTLLPMAGTQLTLDNAGTSLTVPLVKL